MSEILQAALSYLKRGWSVIPLHPGGKKPLLESWEEFQSRRATEEEVCLWFDEMPDANIGIVTGRISGFVVLDVDGEEGKASLKTISGMVLPPTTTATTGKGTHYLFAHPGEELRNRVDLLGNKSHIDVRGDGGYIVAPPSIHPSGAVYEWALDYDMAGFDDVPAWLMKILKESKPSGSKVDVEEIWSGVPQGARNDKLFKYACRLRAKGMTRTEAERLVLDASAKCSPPMDFHEAQTLLDSAWERYQEGTTNEQTTQTAVASLKDLRDRLDQVFETETIGALAVLKKSEPTEYAKIKQSLKGKVNLNDLERAVNQKIKDSSHLRVVEANEPPAKLEDILPDLPMKELRKPYNWNLNENGVWQDSKFGPICACPVPVLLTKRLRNIDTAEEKIEVAFYRDQKWHNFVSERATVFNRNSLINITNKGLPVSSESAKHLVRYLGDLERENLDTLPVVRSVSHMGWAGDNCKQFLPGSVDDVVLDVDDGGGMRAIAGGYAETGDLSGWVESASKVRAFPLARLVMSASFAAPLLRVVGQRIFIVHLWGPSKGGKTATINAALSIWGDPDEIIASFNSTKVGLERLASFYSDLPLGIDERQVVGDKQGFVESLVYLLGLGKGKARGAKGGGLQAFSSWRTVAITTGEEPLSTGSSMAGIKTRALEFYGQPIEDEAVSANIYGWTRQHSGVAGPEFVRRIIAELDKDPEVFIRDYKAVQEKLSSEHKENISSHVAALSVVTLADYYASQWIFGMSEDEALDQAIALAKTAIGMLETAAENDDGIRAYDYFISWYAMNVDYFDGNDSKNQRFGFRRQGYLNIFPPIFDKAMKDGGYNGQRVLRDWMIMGYIRTDKREGEKSVRLKVRDYDPITKQQTYFVSVKLPNGVEGVDLK